METLVKMNGVPQANRMALQLTDKHCYIPVSKLTQRIAQRYITLARFGASAVAAASYDTFENISRASGFCKPTYHHKWAFRSILQATRQYAKVSKLKLKASTTVEEFENVFPDQSKYLKTLAGYYKTRSVKQIMRHLGEKGDPLEFTMWLCFNGRLRSFNLSLSFKSEVAKQIRSHSMAYMKQLYQPNMYTTMQRVAAALEAT